MLQRIEPYLYIAIFAVLSVLLVVEGARASALERSRPVTPEELYRLLAEAKVKPQVLDVRPDVVDNYEFEHIPESIPFPGCDLEATPEVARAMIERSVPTIIVSERGDRETYERCASKFTLARNLSGGFEGWLDSDTPAPTIDGGYEPPSATAGGGCL